MTKEERPAITAEYLLRQGVPVVITPAAGIIAIVSGDGYETVDMAPEQALEVSKRLIDMYVRVGRDDE